VVIAIIAVLAALLLPALEQARFQARKATCASNLKQLNLIMSFYYNDWGTTPSASREMGYEAFGYSKTTVGFGLLTWNGYCRSQAVLACPDTNYIPGSENQLPPAEGFSEPGWAWGFFGQPNTFPMDGVQRFLYGDWDGNSNYKGYGNASSYAYRRGAVQGDYNNVGGVYISYKYRRWDQLPNCYIACAQQWGTQGFGRCTANFTHQRKGSNMLYRDGSVGWLSMVGEPPIDPGFPADREPRDAGCPEYYLPYCYPFDYPYIFPASLFWKVADSTF